MHTYTYSHIHTYIHTYKYTGVELGATTLIPVPLPLGGALVIGEQTITHLNGDKGDTKTIAMGPTVIRWVCMSACV